MKIVTFITVVVLMLTGLAQADVIAQYGFQDTASSTDSEANTTASIFAPGLGATAFSYSGLGQSGKSAYFNNDGFNQISRTNAKNQNDSLQFTIDVASGYAVDFTSFSFYTSSDVVNGAGAPDSYGVYTSQDGEVRSVGTVVGGIVSEGVDTFKKHTLDLSVFSELQSVTDSTEFSIYLWTTDGIAGSSEREFRMDSLVLDGDVSVVPEPATAGMLGLSAMLLLLYRRFFT